MDTIYNKDGCFYRALDDEPVFVLLARDPCAAEAVRWWVTLRQALIGKGEKPLEDHEKLADALRTAQAMVEWRSDATDPSHFPNEPRWKVEHVPQRELVDALEWADLNGRIRQLEETISPPLPLGEPLTRTGGAYIDPAKERLWIDMAEERGLLSAEAAAAQRAALPPMPTAEEVERLDTNPPWYAESIRRAIALGTEGRANRLVEKKLLDFKDDNALVTFHKSTLLAALKAAASDPVKQAQEVDASPVRLALFEIAGRLEAWVGDKVSDRADEARQMVKDIRVQATKIMPLPFIAYDLAGRVAGKLRELIVEYGVTVAATTWPDTRKRQMMGYSERLEAIMTELFDGRMVGDQLRSRTPSMSPLLAMPYEPDSPAAAIAAIGQATGTAFDSETETMRPVDITDTPDMPAHRFAVFDKSDGWAYGRGLEIAPSHIPAMLDRLEKDGYLLVSIVGSQADKIGMMFRRVPPAKGTKAPDVAYLGTYDGHAVYVALQTPRHVRSCIASLLGQPCGPEGRGRGLEP